MPVITLEIGKLEKSQKAELVKSFTEKASKVTKIPKEAFVVVIHENAPENIGVGGKLRSEV